MLRRTYLALIVIVPFALELSAQTDLPKVRQLGIPSFYYDAVSFASAEDGLARLDVFIKVPYDELQFIKRGNIYTASYEISINIFDATGTQADGKIWKEQIDVDDFDLTNSQERFDITKISFDLHNVDYKLIIGIMDLDTRKTGLRRNTIKIKSFSDQKIAVSDIMFVDDTTSTEEGRMELIPNVMNSFVSESSEFLAYYEIYTSQKGKVKINNSVSNTSGKKIYEDTMEKEPEDGVVRVLTKIRREKLRFSQYLMTAEISQGQWKASSEKVFHIRWFGMSAAISNLDLAVEQLRYITNKKKIEEMKDADSDEKREVFTEFWKKRDPTPETEINELMSEYYRRIDYSNEHFSSFRDGWKTDMGMIYIYFGAPNDIERHPFDLNRKPFEIWYYYDINRSFVFQDYSGFGEYRLVTPLQDLSRADF